MNTHPKTNWADWLTHSHVQPVNARGAFMGGQSAGPSPHVTGLRYAVGLLCVTGALSLLARAGPLVEAVSVKGA